MSLFSSIGQAAQGTIFETLSPFGGYLAKKYGDKFDPYSGMPMAPEYDSEGANAVRAGYKAAGEAGQPGQSGLDALRNSALRSGPSPWATMAMQKTGADAAAARQKVTRDVAGQGATASTALAMRGGLQSGARERMARQAGMSRLNLNQDVARQEAGNRMQIGINDEQNRMSNLSMLPGAEMQMAEAKRRAALTGVQGEEKDLDRRMGFNQNLYGQNMAAWASNKQADATMRAAPNKGFLGLW